MEYKEVSLKLLTNIEADQSKEINYLITGRSPTFFNQRMHNCVSFFEYHLELVGLKLDQVERRSLFCAFPSDYLLGAGAQQSATCLVM